MLMGRGGAEVLIGGGGALTGRGGGGALTGRGGAEVLTGAGGGAMTCTGRGGGGRVETVCIGAGANVPVIGPSVIPGELKSRGIAFFQAE